MVHQHAVKQALLLLSQTTNDFLLYKSTARLLTPPNHPGDITIPLSDNTLNIIRWISALTKFTRFFLYYRYVNGMSLPNGEGNMNADGGQFSAPLVLEKLRNWIDAGFVGQFADVQINAKAVARQGKEKVQGLPLPPSEEIHLTIRSFEKYILGTSQPDYLGTVEQRHFPVTDTVYDVLVGGISIEQAAEVGERLTKMVMEWKGLLVKDLLDVGYVRAQHCGSNTPDGKDSVEWNSDAWRLQGLLPQGIFWPADYDWPKYKPSPVYGIPGVVKVGFKQTEPPILNEVVPFDKAQEVVKEVCCAICQDDWEVDDVLYNLPCKHVFHKDCIDKWWASPTDAGEHRVRNCPLCRMVCKWESIFHPDTIPMREPGRRGRDWCWEIENLPLHSPEHYLLNKSPTAGAHQVVHRGLLMWLYVREIYNHGRRLCWAIKELRLCTKYHIREYEGLAVWEEVDQINELFDTRMISTTEEVRRRYSEFQGPLPIQQGIQNRWEDFGWGGVTRAFLRELGATDKEMTEVEIYNPGLAQRTLDTDEEYGFELSLLHGLFDGDEGGGVAE